MSIMCNWAGKGLGYADESDSDAIIAYRQRYLAAGEKYHSSKIQ